jgi:hypothetical protein
VLLLHAAPCNRTENIGFATSLASFYAAQLFARSPQVGLRNASMADIIVYAAALGVARCDGPHVVFLPGRLDTDVADPEDLLAAPTDDFHHILHYFLANGALRLTYVYMCHGASAAIRLRPGAPTLCMSRTPLHPVTAGLSELDAVVLLSSHTTACFAEGCLDSTPTQ